MNKKFYRPWGYYQILHTDISCKIKKIVIEQNQSISYQYHLKRNENWIITEGLGTITIDDKKQKIKKGDSFYIPSGTKHMIENNSDCVLSFIEVQTGSYFGEDDIVRISDIYGRI